MRRESKTSTEKEIKCCSLFCFCFKPGLNDYLFLLVYHQMPWISWVVLICFNAGLPCKFMQRVSRPFCSFLLRGFEFKIMSFVVCCSNWCFLSHFLQIRFSCLPCMQFDEVKLCMPVCSIKIY